MRIQAANAAALAARPTAARRAAGGFSIADAETPRRGAAAGSLQTVGGLDALLALQGVEDATERRKRAVSRGRKALDVLDGLRLSVLDGSVGPDTLARLKTAAEGLTETTGDPGLDGVMAEIGLRVAVELAKAGVR